MRINPIEINEQNTLSKESLQILQTLRQGFLTNSNQLLQKDYWQNAAVLTEYHKWFAKRIGWKWDSFLTELSTELQELIKSIIPSLTTVVDWGCGSGIAAETFLSHYSINDLSLFDKSSLAINFASNNLQKLYPDLNIKHLSKTDEIPPNSLILLSHVLNELEEIAQNKLIEKIQASGIFLWLESGTMANSKTLSAIRTKLSTTHFMVFPCVHQNICPVLMPENAEHWCHQFATPPSYIFQDKNWHTFSTKLNIDLRSLPLSCLIGINKQSLLNFAECPNIETILGRIKFLKGKCQYYSCSVNGLQLNELQQKNNRQLFKELAKKSPFILES